MPRAQYLTKKDIAQWRLAWGLAINVDNPQRLRLYDIYVDALADLHLSGCIVQRTEMVMKKAFRLVSIKDSKENRALTETLECAWFKDFMRLSLESRYWGHSLIQFGDIVNGAFEGVTLVPRRHVVPEYGVIVKNAGDEWKKGFPYREGKLAEWVIEAGGAQDLGLLLKCAPHTISKRNMTAFWDTFGEMFGMPLRIAKTISRDKAEQSLIEKALEGMGAAFWGLFPDGTDIEIKETTRGDAFNVYDRRIALANAEMGKGILGQTLTIEQGDKGARSLGEVHLSVLKDIVEADADFIRDLVNNRLLPFMARHGIDVAGHRFEWDNSIDYTPEQQRAIEQMLLSAGYDIAPEYFADKYNIPLEKRSAGKELALLDAERGRHWWENPDFFGEGGSL